MSEFLLELYSEEIPPKLQINARTQLKQELETSLEEEEVQYKECLEYSSPTRLSIYIKGLPQKIKINSKLKNYFINKFYCPDLPYKFYEQMHKFSNTSMDISDGLIIDMNKLINKQKLSFEIEVDKIPISKNLGIYLKKQKKLRFQNLFNGDDYQILFTATQKNRSLIKSIGEKMNQKLTIIGKINNSNKKNSVVLDNKPLYLSKFKGYSHKF